MISGSIPLRPPSPIISQRHRSTQFLNADSSTSSPALCFPLPVMSFRSRRVEKEERTGSIAASRGRRGWTSSIFVFTLPPPGRRRREERMKSRDGAVGLGSEMSFCCEASHIDTSYSRVSCCKSKEKKDRGGNISSVCPALFNSVGSKRLIMWWNVGSLSGFKWTGHSLLLSRRAGCQTLSPQWSVGTGGGRWEEASSWSDTGT